MHGNIVVFPASLKFDVVYFAINHHGHYRVSLFGI